MKKLTLLVAAFLAGCASHERMIQPSSYTSNSCQIAFHDSDLLDTHLQLDKVSELFEIGCYKEVTHLGFYIRSQRRDKLYSFSAELAEILTPEGTFTPYILESYERSLLSLYISASYLNMNQPDSAQVELRRIVEEEKAILYNYGEDPVIALLLGALWDRFDPTLARPHWKSLHESKTQHSDVKKFAAARMAEIDSHNTRTSWQVYGLGQLPELDWKPKFFQKTPYKITETSPYPEVCSTADSLLIPTSSWTKKVAQRYKSDYHPLVYAKSLARLPVGIGYGIVGVSSGIAVGAGGCALATQADRQAFELCSASLQFAGYIIDKSSNLVEYTLRPDMRHWKKLPRAILISRANPDTTNSCITGGNYTQIPMAFVR